MTKREKERIIFETFLKIDPNFADEKIVQWEQPEDEKEFPDVICKCESGRRVGVELGEWLHEGQIKAAKEMERIQGSIIQALGEQGENPTNNISVVYLIPKSKAHFLPKDAELFRDQLFQFIEEIDQRWTNEGLWQTPQGHRASNDELVNNPILQKYLNRILFVPIRRYNVLSSHMRKKKLELPNDQNWIRFLAHGDWYSEDVMRESLLELLSKKKKHYSAIRTGFHHLCLIIYYNSALIYNSPAETLFSKFSDTVLKVKHSIGNDPAPFNSIFLFIAVGEGKVFKIL